MSYLCYACLSTRYCVSCFVFVLFFVVLCALCFQFLWIVNLFGGIRVAHLFSFFVLSYYVSLHSEFRVVMSATISE